VRTIESVSKAILVNRGRPLSSEHKARIAASLSGRKMTPEQVEKAAATKRGKRLSEETKARISASQKARYAASLALVVFFTPHVSSALECSADSTCVPPSDMQSIVTILQEKQCLSTEKPHFNLDPITIVVDREGRVYYSGSDPQPYSLTMKWCNFEVQGEGKISVVVAKNEPPVWGFRFRPKFAGSYLFVDGFSSSKAVDGVDIGVLWDFLYYKALNVNVATGFRSVGGGVGLDLTRNFGVYTGYALSWWSLKHNPQLGLYFSFW
jgi:hypothetical protein